MVCQDWDIHNSSSHTDGKYFEYWVLSIAISLQKLLNFVGNILPQVVVPLDLEDGVGVHTEAVVLFPDLPRRRPQGGVRVLMGPPETYIFITKNKLNRYYKRLPRSRTLRALLLRVLLAANES